MGPRKARTHYAAIMEQLRQIQETTTDTQTELHIVSNSLDVVHNGLHDVMASSEILAHELGNQTVANHSTATITFNLLFFTSPEIPRSETKRNKANLNQSWIGCSCCEQRNSERTLPLGSRIVYQRVVNSRDTCEFVFRQMKDYFIETNYKHFLIQNNQINDFFNDLDELLNNQSEHESVRNFEAIETTVQERRVAEERERFINELKTRKETRENELTERKKELTNLYGESVYIRVGGYRRKVNLDNWTIRFGRGGSSSRSLSRDEVLNGEFSNRRDPRIRYE